MRSLAIFFALLTMAPAFTPRSRVLLVRVKRQQCGCVRLQAGGTMECACQRPLGLSEVTSADGLAGQVSALSGTPDAQCTCIQIMIETPRYNCMCSAPSMVAPTTTTTTTTTTTPAPTTSKPVQPSGPISTNAAGCQCILLRILTSPTSQYACNCPTGQNYLQTPALQVAPNLILADAPVPPTASTPPPTSLALPAATPPIYQPMATSATTAPATDSTQPVNALPVVTSSAAFTSPAASPPIFVPLVNTAPATVAPPPSLALPPAAFTSPAVSPPIYVPLPSTDSSTAAPTLALPSNPTTVAPPPVQLDQPSNPYSYPATAIANGTSPGCFCLDSGAPNLGCGCACDCLSLTVTVPSGVCVCPQTAAGAVLA